MGEDEGKSREQPSQSSEKEISGILDSTQSGDEKTEDPLGLIRREIAVMKKLEWVHAITNIWRTELIIVQSSQRTSYHPLFSLTYSLYICMRPYLFLPPMLYSWCWNTCPGEPSWKSKLGQMTQMPSRLLIANRLGNTSGNFVLAWNTCMPMKSCIAMWVFQASLFNGYIGFTVS